MHGSELTAEGLLALAALLALLLARRFPHHRPVARALGAFLLSDVLREGLRRLVLVPARVRLGALPFAGWSRVAFHVEQGLFVGFVAVELALFAAVFLPRSLRVLAWGALPAWLRLVAFLVGNYPALRGAPLLALYAKVELGLVIGGAVGVLVLAVRTAWGAGWPGVPQRAALVLFAGAAASFAGPYLHPPEAVAAWWSAHLLNVIGYGLLVVEQGRVLWRSTPARRPAARSS